MKMSSILQHTHSLRNGLDLFLRRHLAWSLREAHCVLPQDQSLQQEVHEFLALFSNQAFEAIQKRSLRAADIGARNFSLGPVLDHFLAQKGFDAQIHGIEIDAHRRFSSLHTRADFGKYYASLLREGYFHALDFLHWQMPLDIAFFLNPFVSEGPLLSWGLPLAHYRPLHQYCHLADILAPSKGIAIVSHPSPEEFATGIELASQAGLEPLETVMWQPVATSVQKMPRLGAILALRRHP